ncbi:peptidase M15, partial [Acinetobacter baumannii]|nr:peptidase M15 [Acinetobacter baumannii]
NLGIGLYSSGQIHIDTQGYRTWGPDLTRNTSMCNF